MAKEIVWSIRANHKFDTILNYLEGEWDEKVTSNFVKRVYDFLDLLAEFPELGTIENQTKNIRGFTIVKQVSLIYKIKGNKIILLNFFDNRQDPKKKRF